MAIRLNVLTGQFDLVENNHTNLLNIGTNTHAQIDTFIGTTVPATYLPLAGGTMTGGITNSTSINPLTTLAESWIGPSTTTGIYFKGGNVGIGTTSPVGQLQITDTAASSATRGLLITQHNNGIHAPLFSTRKSRGTAGSPTAVTSGDYLGLFDWYGYVGGTNSYVQGSRIISIVNGAVTDSTAGLPTDLGFFTNKGDGSTGLTEKMRIINNGNVGIGTTGPGKKLDVDGDIRADNFTGSDRYAFMMSG